MDKHGRGLSIMLVMADALEYMSKEESWYVDKDGWMVLLRPRESYTAGEVSAYTTPWESIATTAREKIGEIVG